MCSDFLDTVGKCVQKVSLGVDFPVTIFPLYIFAGITIAYI